MKTLPLLQCRTTRFGRDDHEAQRKREATMSLSNKRLVDQDHSSLRGVRVLVVEDAWHVAKR